MMHNFVYDGNIIQLSKLMKFIHCQIFFYLREIDASFF